MLAVKGNQGKLHEVFESHFSIEKVNQWKGDIFRTEEKSHGRMEARLHIVSDIFDEFVNLSFDWKGMKTLGIILSARMEDGVFNTDDISVRYYISSAELTAEEFAHAAREH